MPQLKIHDDVYPIPARLSLQEAVDIAERYGITPVTLPAVDYPEDPLNPKAWQAMCWLALNRAGREEPDKIVAALAWDDFDTLLTDAEKKQEQARAKKAAKPKDPTVPATPDPAPSTASSPTPAAP